MNLPEKFHTEVYRPLLTHFIPGLVLGAPYFVLVCKLDRVQSFACRFEATTGFLIVIACLGVGHLLEDLGSVLEVHCLDKRSVSFRHDEKRIIDWKRREEEWWRYLRCCFETEPVGHRYLRTVLLRLKLELSLCIAVPMAFIGWIAVAIFETWNLNAGLSALSGVLATALPMYLYWEAGQSSDQLARVRNQLLKGPIKMYGPNCE
jgi:hypothetical protein